MKYSTRQFDHWIGIRKEKEGGDTLSDLFVSITPDDLKRHCLIIGSTGSGKTTLIHHLIAQNIQLQRSTIILDFRGDLVNATLELCAGHVEPERIALFDLREKEKPLGFNPLSGIGEGYFRALGILDVVEAESSSWGPSLAENLRYALLLFAEVGEVLPNLERLFFDARFREELLARCPDQQIVNFWLRYGALSREKQSALATPVLNKVSLLFATKALRRTLAHPKPLDLGKHLNSEGTICLIAVAIDELHMAGKWMAKIFLASICREIFGRINIPERDRIPIHLIVDEFENFQLDVIEQILAEGRRFRLHVTLANQVLAQIGTRMRSMILNNAGVKVVFRTGREDSALLSKDLTGDSKLLDLCSLPVGECFLWKQGREPIHVETNAPLVRNVGTLSEGAKNLVAAIRANIPEFTELAPVTLKEQGEIRPTTRPKSRVANLEEWL